MSISTMPQVSEIKRYRPKAVEPFPFPKSGSDWTLKQLNYIGIDQELDCALDAIIPPTVVLSPKITEFLIDRLNKPWEDLLSSKFKEDRETFYARLLQVADPKSEGGPYDIPSSQPSESTPPLEPRTPQGSPNLVQPPRPSPQYRHRPGSLWSSPVSPTPAKNPGNLPDTTPQISSDPSYEPSSSNGVESDSDREQEKDQAEMDVQALTRSLLYLIENAVSKVLPSIETETCDPPKLFLMIDGSLMSTQADIALNIQIGKEKAEIFLECKKKGHTKKADELTGQEIAHMIGTTFAFRRDVKELDKYTTYLISWHHTECYFSRLDVTDKHIRQLVEEKVDNRPHDLSVKRSRTYDVLDHEERVEVAKAITRLLVLEVQKYSRSLARHMQV